MTTCHPQQHPAARTFGLDEAECAELRFAAETTPWRYILADRLFHPSRIPAILASILFSVLVLDDEKGIICAICIVALARLAGRTYDWTRRRRLGRELGYGRQPKADSI
jgi:hypothetical protein